MFLFCLLYWGVPCALVGLAVRPFFYWSLLMSCRISCFIYPDLLGTLFNLSIMSCSVFFISRIVMLCVCALLYLAFAAYPVRFKYSFCISFLVFAIDFSPFLWYLVTKETACHCRGGRSR